MTSKLYDLARMTTATTGTGTITLGSAVSGFLTFAGAGAANGDVVSYGISDGANSEVGTGTYTSSGTTLSRTVTKSTNSNSAISLSGTAQVFILARAEDLVIPAAAVKSDMVTATSTTLFVDPGVQQYHPAHPKAVAYITQSAGTYTLAYSYGISGISKAATGRIDITLSPAFASTTYGAIGSPNDNPNLVVNEVTGNRTASNFRARITNANTNADTDSTFCIAFYGAQ